MALRLSPSCPYTIVIILYFEQTNLVSLQTLFSSLCSSQPLTLDTWLKYHCLRKAFPMPKAEVSVHFFCLYHSPYLHILSTNYDLPSRLQAPWAHGSWLYFQGTGQGLAYFRVFVEVHGIHWWAIKYKVVIGVGRWSSFQHFTWITQSSKQTRGFLSLYTWGSWVERLSYLPSVTHLGNVVRDVT